jgi:hypothetical protein
MGKEHLLRAARLPLCLCASATALSVARQVLDANEKIVQQKNYEKEEIDASV